MSWSIVLSLIYVYHILGRICLLPLLQAAILHNLLSVGIIYNVNARYYWGYWIIYHGYKRLNGTCVIRINYESFNNFMWCFSMIIFYFTYCRYHISGCETSGLRKLWLIIKLNLRFSLLNEINFAFGGVKVVQETLHWILLNNSRCLNQVLIMDCCYWGEVILKRWRRRNSWKIEPV